MHFITLSSPKPLPKRCVTERHTHCPLPPIADATPATFLAGARAADPGERAFLQATPELDLWSAQTVRSGQWRGRVDDLLEHVAAHCGRLYVSLDRDVVDPGFAPGVAVPVPNGALPEPLLALLARVSASGVLAGADVVELYPPTDRNEQTACLAARAVRAIASSSCSTGLPPSPVGATQGG